MHSDVLDDRFFATLAEFLSWMHGPRKDVVDVESGRLLTRVATASPEDAQESLMTVQAAQVVWTEMGPYGRAKVLARFSQSVWKYQNEMVALAQMLSGKSLIDAHEEFLDVLSTAQNIKFCSRKLGKRRAGRGVLPGSRWRVHHRPLGTVGIFTSPDWPLSSVNDVLQAIAAGNAVVNFVTPQATLGALLMKAVLVDAGMPADVWRIVVSESSQFGMKFIPALDYVTAIGPNRMCQRISMECARHSVPISCFGAVKKIALVMEDAKLWDAAKACARSAFLSAGQSTNSIEVIFVHEAVREPFEQMMVQYTQEQIRVGRYTNPHATMGSMMYPDRVKNCEKVLKLARDNGARVLMGSHSRPEISPTFFEPTIVADLPPELNLLETEVYGPLVALISFNDITNVVRLVTGSRVIDSAAVFTRDIDFVRNLIDNAEFATVCVNDTYFSMDMSWKAPIQGKGESGQGIRHGLEAILQYTQVFSAARLKGISWVPKDWRSGNWTERLTFAFMGLYSWMSRNVTDTVGADGIRAIFRWMRDRFVGPV